MCDTCGCGQVSSFKVIRMGESAGGQAEAEYQAEEAGRTHTHEHSHEDGRTHTHEHSHEHGHTHEHAHEHTHDHGHGEHTHTVPVHLPLLAKNDRLAERNRGYLKGRGVFAINVVSSPGSGKTTLLAATLEKAGEELRPAVIVGDLETAADASRLRGKGAPVVQVTTGAVCHLDAEMVQRALDHLELEGRRLLIIENVGNLVCPASYDLGEGMRVVLISVTEGEDKPLKYPPIFRGAGAVVITKMDMLEAAGLDLEALRRNIAAVAPEAKVLELSARTGQGMEEWVEFLRGMIPRTPGIGADAPRA